MAEPTSRETNTTPYGHLISDSWRWSRTVGVSLTSHALDRWDERTPWNAVSPETAWEHGVTVSETVYGIFADRTGNWPDEVRTFCEDGEVVGESYQVVLIAREGVIKTVLAANMLRGPERAYLAALRHRIDQPNDRVRATGDGEDEEGERVD